MRKIGNKGGIVVKDVILIVAIVAVAAILVIFWTRGEPAEEEVVTTPVMPSENSASLEGVEPTEPVYGNTPANIYSMGQVAQDDEWIYFRNTDDEDKLYRMDMECENRQKLCDEPDVHYINVVGNTVYFTDDNGRINRINKDGGIPEELYSDVASYVSVVDDWIYFINARKYPDENGVRNTIWKIKTDGSDLTMLYSESVLGGVYIANQQIYFCRIIEDDPEENGVYRMDLDGNDLEKIIDGNVVFLIDGEWVYYFITDQAKENYRVLTRIKLAGSQEETICEDSPILFNVNDDWLYYCDTTDGNHIYRMRIGETSVEKIKDAYGYDISFAGKWMTYNSNPFDDAEAFYKGDTINFVDIEKLE